MTSTRSTPRSIWPESALRASLADFLRRHPDELASGPVHPTPLGWFDANRASELIAVHRQMLEAGYESDERRHGRADYWAVDARGDCEDKALWCHRRLAGLGWPKPAMRLWLCLARQACRWRGHALLIVAVTLSSGIVVDVALDCLRATPTRKADLGYRLWRVVDMSAAEIRAERGAAGQD
jgi:predicted transglutaminase-like cysteine proteinase